jgi:peptide deformylase
MPDDIAIIRYPDPRLRKMSEPVTQFTPELRALALRMLELMKEARGVGLAAPQVGQNIRLFVISPTGEEQDIRIYVNPLLSDAQDEDEGEEGCLSLPNLTTKVWRSKRLRMNAQDLDGNPFEETAEGYIARIWQHESDHLNGTLIIDRMGPVAKLAARRILKELQQKWDDEHPDSKKTKR